MSLAENNANNLDSPRVNWPKWLIVGAVLIAAHGASAAYYSHRYADNTVAVGAGPLTLDLPIEDWAAKTMGADSSAYLRSAVNVAAGKGVTIDVPGASPPRTEPFYYWGPGAPLAFGGWLKLTGGQTMQTFFWFAVVVQLFFGVMAVATVNLYTHKPLALALTAFCTGFCPPLQEWFCGTNLTSSEIVALVPLSLLMFALAKGFLAYRTIPGQKLREAFRGPWRGKMPWRLWGWFAAASVLIGLQSLVRDSATALGSFLACFLIGRSLLLDRGRLLLAVSTAGIVLVGVYLVRQPVKTWNKRRVGNSIVCTSSEGCIWRYGLWMKHDQYDWYQPAGLGFGEYLDPEAAVRVEEYFKSGQPRPELYSLKQFVQAVAARPGDAIAFKAARLPVLWLGGECWPTIQWRLAPEWSMAFYAMFAVLIAVRLWRRQYLPEPIYVYFLLILCASPLIHFEFRYTFPVWNALVLVPGLLAASIGRDGLRRSSPDRLWNPSSRLQPQFKQIDRRLGVAERDGDVIGCDNF